MARANMVRSSVLCCVGLWASLAGSTGAIIGCGGTKSEFIAGRVLDRCNGTWPVCDRIAGCLIGPESYLEGRFPGEGRFLITIAEPSKVKIRFFLEDASAAGEETAITFFEDRCRSRIREAVSGRSLLGEAEQFGEFAREVTLTGLGDHLIEFTSDAQGRYALKVDVLPIRLAGSGE